MKKLLPPDSGRVDIEQLELKGFTSSIAEIEWLLLLVIISSAITLGKIITLLEIVLIATVYLPIACCHLGTCSCPGFSRVMHFEAYLSPT